MKDHVIMQYSRINDQLFIGTNACCETHFKKALLDQGVTTDISMEAERIDGAFGVERYLWLPTVDHAAPSLENLLVGTSMIKEVIDVGEMVYVHCLNGHGRGPTLGIAYFIRFENKTADEAIDFVSERRPEVHLEKGQIERLREFEKRCLA